MTIRTVLQIGSPGHVRNAQLQRVFEAVVGSFIALVALLFLSGCETQSGKGHFRDRSVPIASTTRFEPERLAGDWWVRAAFSDGQVTARQVTYEWDANDSFRIGPKGGSLVSHKVTEGARWQAGRGHPEVWLLWVDADYRTAAIGNPDGTVGMILDRSKRGGDDRMKAASEILDWYGYDMIKLQEAE